MKIKLLFGALLLTVSTFAFAGQDCFLGEVNYFPYNFTPAGYLEANGASLPIQQYSALYSLIGVKYGGGQTTFNLPKISAIKVTNSETAPIKAYICIDGIYPNRP